MSRGAASPVLAPARLIAELLTAGLGGALWVGAACANQPWFDRHFLPIFFLTRDQLVLGQTVARWTVVLIGGGLIFVVRPVVGRALNAVASPLNAAGGALRIILAMTLALGASEMLLRLAYPRAREEAPPEQEPLRRRDAHLGWVFVPSRVGRAIVAGRAIAYAFDARGNRVADLDHPVDPTRPTILFAGESIMCGFGLPWAQSIPALVAAGMRRQSANLAVFGYADDQTLMRLRQEAPRFTHPTAVVILFSPGLVFRDLDTDRPRLGPGQIWSPAVSSWRLENLARFYIPYHSEAAIDRTIAKTRAELTAGVMLAKARGATALIVIPQFGSESPPEKVLRQRILDDARLPYIKVNLDPAWRIAHDVHPDARGAQAIAGAIIARLSLSRTAPGIEPQTNGPG